MNAVGLVLLTRILSCLNYILPYPIVGGDWIYQWSDVGVDRRYAYTIPTHSAMWQTLQSLSIYRLLIHIYFLGQRLLHVWDKKIRKSAWSAAMMKRNEWKAMERLVCCAFYHLLTMSVPPHCICIYITTSQRELAGVGLEWLQIRLRWLANLCHNYKLTTEAFTKL